MPSAPSPNDRFIFGLRKHYTVHNLYVIYLVGGFSPPLWKMMELKSVGMMTFPRWWESHNPVMFQTTNLLCDLEIYIDHWPHDHNHRGPITVEIIAAKTTGAPVLNAGQGKFTAEEWLHPAACGCLFMRTIWDHIGSYGIPSGKRFHNYEKSPFLMGKSTINDHFQ